jgi:serine/threonine protein kinase
MSPVPSAARREQTALEPGRVVGDRFRVIAPLASGGMGEVALAKHLALGIEVALKVARRRADVSLLRAEALALHRARHPGVVAFLDFGELPGGSAYLAMEFVRGGNLASLLTRRGPLEPSAALRLLRPLAEALDHVHAVGLVHRDVKPGNVLVDPALGVKLCDFGFAREMGSTVPSGLAEGTPEHMAPEQALGGVVTSASDRWALAALALQCLTGHRVPSVLMGAPTGAERSVAVEPDAFGLEPDRWGSELLHRFFARALAQDVALRPRTSSELLSGLEAALLSSRRSDGALRSRTSSRTTHSLRSPSLRAVVPPGSLAAMSAGSSSAPADLLRSA